MKFLKWFLRFLEKNWTFWIPKTKQRRIYLYTLYIYIEIVFRDQVCLLFLFKISFEVEFKDLRFVLVHLFNLFIAEQLAHQHVISPVNWRFCYKNHFAAKLDRVDLFTILFVIYFWYLVDYRFVINHLRGRKGTPLFQSTTN